MNTIHRLLLVALLVFSSFIISASSAESGEKIYRSRKINCAQCHGKKGMGMAKRKADGKYKLSMTKGPRIAGLPVKDIKTALIHIQDKKREKLRKTKYSSMMKSRIKKLSPEDIESLALYINKIINPSAGEYKSEIWPR